MLLDGMNDQEEKSCVENDFSAKTININLQKNWSLKT